MFNKSDIDRALNKIYAYVSGWIIVRLAKPQDLAEYVCDDSYMNCFNSIVIRKSQKYGIAKRFIACLNPLKDKDIEYIIKKHEIGVVDVIACNRFVRKKKHLDALANSPSYDVLSKLAGNVNLMPEHIDKLIDTGKSEIIYNIVRYHPLTQEQTDRIVDFLISTFNKQTRMMGFVLIPFFKNQTVSDEQIVKILKADVSHEAYYQAIKHLNAKKS